MNIDVSVLMPVFNGAHFLGRAIKSLQAQTLESWELIIINDGSTDNTEEVILNSLKDRRIRYYANEENIGLGACLNRGFELVQGSYIAYLPADDIFYKDHLESLFKILEEEPVAVGVFSSVRHHYNKTAVGQIDNYPLQLVQVMHRRSWHRWTERAELVTDDLNKLFWNKLYEDGIFMPSAIISCEWVDHPDQWHKVIREPLGGINPYKLRYGVKHPLRFHSSVGNLIDEVELSEYYKNHPKPEITSKSLKILIVGELAYNHDRILALEEQGHQLFGLWMKEPYWYNNIGPLAFGHLKDLKYNNWKEEIKQIQPDVIYGLLNWQAVPFAHEILMENPGIPFVWHFKEGPFICLEKGSWNQLLDLYTFSDGQIYTSEEMRDWCLQFLSPADPEKTFILDGDLPKKNWLTEEQSPLLSDVDGEIHTVVPGRPIGLHPYTVEELAEYNIHVHFYGDFTHGQWKEWINNTLKIAPQHLHIHPNCPQKDWVKEFSQYDAGWLHFFQSNNNGELMRANWDDLNIPARMSTLAAAGLPMLQRNNDGHLVATQSLVKAHDLGVFFKDMGELAQKLYNKQLMNQIRKNVWDKRNFFTFDQHVPELIEFFRNIMKGKETNIKM